MRKILVLAFMTAALCQGAWAQRMTREQYIETYKLLAIEKQETHGIPASITMAQGLLESDNGNSRLAVEANNHFGIKCKKEWTGPTISHDDDAKGECFRRYATAEESYRDHSEFLDKSPRYQSLFELKITDYKGWAHGLKAAGYATNPTYAEQLIKIIEDNQLYLLDSGRPLVAAVPQAADTAKVVEAPTPVVDKIDVDNYMVSMRSVKDHKVYINNGSEFVVAGEGETIARMAMLTGVSEKKLRKYNEFAPAYQPAAGEPVYIRPKSSKAHNGKLIHVSREGETLHSISQTYGIQLKRLVNLNRRPADAPLASGMQIRLM